MREDRDVEFGSRFVLRSRLKMRQCVCAPTVLLFLNFNLFRTFLWQAHDFLIPKEARSLSNSYPQGDVRPREM